MTDLIAEAQAALDEYGRKCEPESCGNFASLIVRLMEALKRQPTGDMNELFAAVTEGRAVSLLGKRYVPEDTIIHPPPPAPIDEISFDGIHCCLCLNFDGTRIRANMVVDGYSVCENHHDELLDARDTSKPRNPRLWFNTDGTFNLTATVVAHRKSRVSAT